VDPVMVRRQVGMVFQRPNPFPTMSIRDNVLAGVKLNNRRISRTDSDDLVEESLRAENLWEEVTDRLDKPGSGISGGQQQRVALARALVFNPQLVLMDEPLGALDKQLREHMQLELKALHRRLGVTFVYVTHDQSEALTMSDRVAVFSEGVIQQIDQVDRLYETPSNRFVASFVGDNSVLDAQVVQTTGEHCEVALADGTRLTGVNVNQAQTGETVQCSVRPERITVVNGSGPTGNRLGAAIGDVIYFGDHLRLRCQVSGQPEISVKVPLQHLGHMDPGQAVHLHIPPEHLRIYR
jgi:putative spermidine/putrescine transport system ATP-binding protein